MKWYNIDWKDNSVHLWKDCVIEPTLKEMLNNPNIKIIRYGFRTET